MAESTIIQLRKEIYTNDVMEYELIYTNSRGKKKKKKEKDEALIRSPSHPKDHSLSGYQIGSIRPCYCF